MGSALGRNVPSAVPKTQTVRSSPMPTVHAAGGSTCVMAVRRRPVSSRSSRRAACSGRLPRLDEAAGQAVDALAELHAKLVDERDVLARSVREHHDDRVRAVVLQVLERVDIPVAADHLIRARAAGAVDIVQVVAVQERAAVLLFNVNELQCGSPLWS